MDTKTIIKTLETVREQSKERKFSQTFDLIVTLKGLNLKKTEEQVEFFIDMPHNPGKKRKVCALVGPEMEEKAKEACDKVITQPDFAQYKDKKELKKLAAHYDYFIAQADIMPKVAAAFGRAFGPRGKMPNPKAGCIIPPKAPVQPLYDKLQKMAKIAIKKQMAVQLSVGTTDMDTKAVAENIKTIHDQIAHHLPGEYNNIKHVLVKLTMGKPVKVE